MGRTRRSNSGLPKRVYLKSGTYWWVSPENKWHKLGRTRADMFRALATLEAEGDSRTMDGLIARYLREITPGKAPASQTKDHQHARRLREVFGPERPQNIQPIHITRYLRARSSPVSANREKALLSHLFNVARTEWGLPITNPCDGVRRNKEQPRDRYVTHAELEAVAAYGLPWFQRFLRVYYLIGQRPADVLSLDDQALRADGLILVPAKTQRHQKALLVEWSRELRAAVQAAADAAPGRFLFGSTRAPYKYAALNSAFRRARSAAMAAGDLQQSWQLRDIRAKTASDGGGQLLAHSDQNFTDRVYIRNAKKVKPLA